MAEYSMYSNDGNQACEDLVQKIITKLGNITLADSPKEVAIEMLKEGVDKIQKTYSEVWDSEPMYGIIDEVNRLCLHKYELDLDIDTIDLI